MTTSLADSLPLDALALQVIVPVLDLRGGDGRPAPAAALAQARELARRGVGGFILFGGEADALAAQLAALRAEAPHGLLISADLERGVGQQVRGGAHLPPLLALGAAADEELARRAGAAVAREALALGIDWLLGPVLDLADEPKNPIVGTRSLGADPERVAALGAALVRGTQEAGALACAKHFPGHGATTDDSHAALPVVARSEDDLRARDLLPFRRAIEAGVASVMTAHVVYPTLSSSRSPATLDASLVQGLLREELGFDGLVVTDALIMDGVLIGHANEGESACHALAAGCDALLYPKDPLTVAAAVAAWARESAQHEARLREAARRVFAAKARTRAVALELAAAHAAAHASAEHVALALASGAITRSGPTRPALRAGDDVGLLVLDDDAVPGLGHEVVATLAAAGVTLTPATLGPEPSADALVRARAAAERPRVVALVGCRVRAWKGRAGLAPALQDALRALPADRLTVAALCGPAPLQGVVPAGAEALVGYGDEPCVQRALAGALLGEPAPGREPLRP
jgi:beta-glucosidase-like glycosyl hydrolase